MSINIPAWFARQYATNVQLKLQIMGSVLRPYVTEGSYTGEAAQVVDQIGAVEMQPVTQRFAPMGRVDSPLDSRWVYPQDWDLPQLFDKFDKLRTIVDEESPSVQNAVIAAGRQIDRIILKAFTADAKTGVNGGTTTTVVAGNEVDVAVGGANSKLNVAKLLEVIRLARANYVDLDRDPLYGILTAADNASLMQEIQVISSDFNGGMEKPVLQSGKITQFLGINFVYCELAETVLAGTNEVNVPFWVKSGMHLGIWNDVTTSTSVRNDIQGEPFQAYLKMTMGATRIEENKVYNVEPYRA